MTTQISGTTGVSLVQDGAVTQPKLGENVAGTGPAFSAYLSADQTIPSAAFTKVQINTEEFDTSNSYDAVTNYRFQPNVAGYYQINWVISNTSSTSATRLYGSIYKNGTIYMSGADIPTGTGIGNFASGSALVYLNGSTDYVELFAYIIATTAKIFAGSASTKLQGYLVRAA